MQNISLILYKHNVRKLNINMIFKEDFSFEFIIRFNFQ